MGKIKNERDFDTYNVNPKKYLKIETKETAYILGLLWADGYLRNDSIFLWLIKEDAIYLKNIFESDGNWKNYYRQLKGRKEQMCYHTHNKFIFNFLIENDYKNKSYLNQNKILSFIPEEFKNYFFLGYFDGDGSIYTNSRSNMLNITSTYEQDWSTVIELFDKLNINYSEIKFKSEKSSYSRILIQNMKGIVNFFDYIYKNGYEFGLKRKYNKFSQIKKKFIKNELKRIENQKIFCICGSNNIQSRGPYKSDKMKRRYSCKECKKNFIK